ncbi:DMT family transporter [Lutimonas sp.]|uniref:DMT family transporter n=1 Tax=Lutimonas sp. TaxID=1872403 RepID=UPI003D9BB5C2
MDKRVQTVNFIELNLAILFISTSGALGRFIDLPIPITIGLRSLLGGIALYLFCRWKKISFRIEGKDRKTVVIGGILLGLHWITYFYSLRLSNVAIGMLSLFTYPAITAILEPIFLKTKILKIHLLLSLLVLVGIYFLVPDFDLQNDDFKAVGFGVLSAFCYATRNIILKTKINQYDGTLLMAYQLLVITLVLSPFAFYLDTSQVVAYLPATLLLAILTTAIGHSLFLRSLRHFSTVTASIVSCSQPVYGIIIGMIFLNEYPEVSTIIGGAIIILTVIIESLRVFRISKPLANDQN